MATHASIHAWRIPWTEEPGGQQSMGSQSWTRLKQLNINSVNFTLLCCAVLCLVAQLHLTGVGCHALLQGIFPV